MATRRAIPPLALSGAGERRQRVVVAPRGPRRTRWRRGLSEPGNAPFSDAAQPYAAIVKTLEGEAYAEDDVVHARHPQCVDSLNEALGNLELFELHSRSCPKPIGRIESLCSALRFRSPARGRRPVGGLRRRRKNTARIARATVNVAICRAFLRSVLP